ncbi:MAG: ribbon-helix-helix protein, CopG family [Methylococcaceae bacterium]|nr:MAG: ribbon-helix-helix protein, CopG family [Methylococcaceae bacterium]
MTTSEAVKLDDATYERLKALAESRQRTPHWLMGEAIKQFLEREEAAESIKQDTLKRLARFEATGEAVPYETVDTWLATWGSP